MSEVVDPEHGNHTSNFAKFLRGLGRKSEELDPAPSVVDMLADGVALIYRGSTLGSPGEKADKAYQIYKQLPDDIKKGGQPLLDALHIDDAPDVINDQATDAFRKEDQMQVSRNRFQIVTDGNNADWLLKSVTNKQWEGHDSVTNVFEQVDVIRRLQVEELAFLVANAINYPVAPTRIVQKDSKPWVAYRYIPSARDYSSFELDSTRDGLHTHVSNPEAILARPLFNALAGSIGDASDQAITDADGHYYAQDIILNNQAFEENASIEDISNHMAQRFQTGIADYGPVNRGIAGESQAYAEFIDKLSVIDHSNASAIVQSFAGSEQEKQVMADTLVKRARALEKLQSDGFFTVT